jgi:Tfp pilus assembly protein PilO
VELVGLITKQKNRIADIAIILLTIIIMSNIYKSQAKAIKSVRDKIDAETQRYEVLGNMDKSNRIISAYNTLINTKDISLAINNISNIARDAKINILFIKPAATEEYPAYTKSPFNMVMSAASYHEIGRFINKLESHPDIYFVDSIIIKPKEIIGKGSAKEYNLNAELTISTILFKDKN